MLRSLVAVALLAGGALALCACTASAPAQPAVSTPARPSVGPTSTEPTAPAVAYSAGQASALLPDDSARAAGGARVDPLSPFSLGTVGSAVSDAHLAQSTTPSACGIVNGLWYASAADGTITDPLLSVGLTPETRSGETSAVEAVRVFRTADEASAHFASLVDAVASCSAFTEEDTQAGATEFVVDDVRAEPDELSLRESISDGGGAATDMAVRVRVVGNLLATVTVVGADGAALADSVDGFVEDRAASLRG